MARRRINKRPLLILIGPLIVLVGLVVGMYHGKWRQLDPQPYITRGDQLSLDGQYRQAASQYNRANLWAGRNGDTKTQAIALLKLSQVFPHLETEQAVGRALSFLSQAVAKDPANPDVRKARLEMYYDIARDAGNLDRWRDVGEYAQDVIDLESDNAQAHYLLGLSGIATAEIRRDPDLAMLEARKTAIPSLQKACEFAPESFNNSRMLCRTYLGIAGLIARMRAPLPVSDRELVIDYWYKADNVARQFQVRNQHSGSAMVLLAELLNFPRSLVQYDLANQAVELADVGSLTEQELFEYYLDSFRLDSARPPLAQVLAALDSMNYGYLLAAEKADTDHTEVQLAMAQYWLAGKRRDLSKAVAALHKAAGHEEDMVSKLRLYLRIADTYTKDAQYDRALEVYEEALELPVDFKSLRAPLLRSTIYEIHHFAARTLLTLATQVNRAETNYVERVNALLDQAQQHIDTGDDVVGTTVTNPATLTLQGSIGMARLPRTQQSIREAISRYEQARDQMQSINLGESRQSLQQYINLHKSLAMAYDMDGQSGAAEEALTKGIGAIRDFAPAGLADINPRVNLYLIELQLKNGNTNDAKDGLESLLGRIDRDLESASPDTLDLIATALLLKVRLYRLQADPENALRTAEQVYQRFPNRALSAVKLQFQILQREPDSALRLDAILKRWIRLSPDDPTPWALLTEVYLGQDQRARAIEILENAVSQNPKLKDSLSRLIEITMLDSYEDRLALQAKHLEDLADPLQRHMGLYRLYSGASAHFQQRVAIYRLQGRTDDAKQAQQFFVQTDAKALAALQQAYEIRPDEPGIYEPLLSVYLSKADWDKAQPMVDRAKEKNWDGVNGVYYLGRLHSARASVLISKDRAEALKEQEQALRCFERAVLDRPTFYQAWANRSAVETNLGRYEDAFFSAKQAVKQNPNSIQTLEALLASTTNEWRRAGRADDLIAAQRYAKEALGIADHILKLQPYHSAANSLQLAYLDSFEPEQAVEKRLSILNAVPNDRNNLLALIAAYKKLNQLENIRQLLLKLIAEQPDAPDLVLELVDIYHQDRQYDLALEQIVRAQQRWPDRIDVATLLAETYRLSGESAKALACLEDFLPIVQQQQKWAVYRSLGLLQKQLGRPEDAARYFRLAIADLKDRQPPESRAACDMAVLLYSANAHQEALEVISAYARENDQYAIGTLVSLYKQTGQPDKAVEWARVALKAEPDSVSAKISLAGALLNADEPVQAQTILEEVISQLREDPSALPTPYLMLSEAQFMQRQYDLAAGTLANAINSGVNAPAVRMRLASYYRFQGRFDDASQQYYLILRKHSGNNEARMALVDSLVRQGSFDQAERILEEGRSIDPTAYQWAQQLANLWLARKDQPVTKRHEKALEFALQANRESGGIVSTAISVMSIHNLRSQYQQCEEFYRTQVPENQKDHYAILRYLGWAKAGRWRQAKVGTVRMTLAQLDALERETVDLFQQVMHNSLENDDIESYMAATGGLIAVRELDRLILDTQQSLSGDPQNTRARIFMSTLLNQRAIQGFSTRQTAKAQQDLNDAVGLLEPLSGNENMSLPLRIGVLSQLASSYTYLRSDEKARDVYLSLLKINPDNIRVLNNLAYILSNSLNKPGQALPHIERALRFNPKDANMLDTYGWTLFKVGDSDRAVLELQRSIDIHPTAITHYHLGAALNAVGETQLALNSLRESSKLLENDPATEAEIGNDVRNLIEQLETN